WPPRAHLKTTAAWLTSLPLNEAPPDPSREPPRPALGQVIRAAHRAEQAGKAARRWNARGPLRLLRAAGHHAVSGVPWHTEQTQMMRKRCTRRRVRSLLLRSERSTAAIALS